MQYQGDVGSGIQHSCTPQRPYLEYLTPRPSCTTSSRSMPAPHPMLGQILDVLPPSSILSYP